MAFSALLPSRAFTQVNRPTAERLPAPRPVVARQVADGRIEVTWGSVPDAASYKITRSVPPTPAQVVFDPDPSDTVFIDNDVTAGKTYYYVLQAVNQQGGAGLNGPSQPVLAAAQPDTTTRRDTTVQPAQAALAAPEYFTAMAFPWPYVSFFWTYPSAMAFVVERAIVGGDKSALDWKVRFTTPTLPCCRMTATDGIIGLNQNARAIYRVIAIDRAAPGRKSPPKESDIIYPVARSGYLPGPNRFRLPPVEGRETTIKVGQRHERDGTGDRYMALESTIVTLNPDGSYVGKAPGVTYLIKARMLPDGSPTVSAERVTVLP